MGLLLEGTTGAFGGPSTWALLGALIATSGVGLLLLIRGRRRRRLGFLQGGALESPQAEAARQEIERLEGGLRQFAREVEERLDSKLDRLELLVREADRVLKGLDAHTGSAPDGRKTTPSAPSSLSGASSGGAPSNGASTAKGGAAKRRDPLDAITSTERDRVLSMNREGLAPEAIAEATAMRRGEVDLILRLEEISQRSTRTA